jgi:hypothetical protein
MRQYINHLKPTTWIEVLYNILAEFCMPMELVRLIKM